MPTEACLSSRSDDLASKIKGKTAKKQSFLLCLFIWDATRRCGPPRSRVVLPISDDPVKKTLVHVPSCLGFI